MDSCLHSGLNWLTRSGIQHPTGAVFAEYDSLTASYRRVSTEAAAWSIQAVLGLGEPPDEARRNVAISAGRYLMERSFDLQADLFVDDPTAEPRLAGFMGGIAALRALSSPSRRLSSGTMRPPTDSAAPGATSSNLARRILGTFHGETACPATPPHSSHWPSL